MYCRAWLYKPWYISLSGKVDHIEGGNASGGEVEMSVRWRPPILEVESILMLYLRAIRLYKENSIFRSAYHTNIPERAIPFRQTGTGLIIVLIHLNYITDEDVPMTDRWYRL